MHPRLLTVPRSPPPPNTLSVATCGIKLYNHQVDTKSGRFNQGCADAGCRGIAPPNLHTYKQKHYIFISRSHTYPVDFLEYIYICIVFLELIYILPLPLAHALFVVGVFL